ncbi:hypothetical protein DXM21_19785 [Agrobacterium rosae]|nr:hypothetical protein DXM21_19785 [Agrobacterium rosae]KAA3514979.1 hypothetical protein DXM25_20585 [Agrobacterium rosae]MQB50695.1 hypothetical protein [Agrobacterium rosae]
MLITKLLESTQSGRISWEAGQPLDEFSTTSFTAALGDKKLRLFRYSREIENPMLDPDRVSFLSNLVTFHMEADRFSRPKTITDRSHIMQFLDRHDRVLYQIKNNDGLSDLFSVISRKAAGIDELLGELSS